MLPFLHVCLHRRRRPTPCLQRVCARIPEVAGAGAGAGSASSAAGSSSCATACAATAFGAALPVWVVGWPAPEILVVHAHES